MMDNAPCYKCKDRHTACHDTCERFEKFHDEMERIKEERRRAQRARSAAFMPHICKNIPRK